MNIAQHVKKVCCQKKYVILRPQKRPKNLKTVLKSGKRSFASLRMTVFSTVSAKRIAVCELGGQSGHEAGRELLRRLYRDETGEELPEIVIQERGKPCFADSPLHFSISHTPRHCFCVLSSNPVGIDAEEIDRDINLKLADKILSPGEKAQFDAAADKRTALLTFWVLKEAAAKLTGEGLRGYPNRTNFSLEDPRVRLCHGCLVAVMEEGDEHAV